MCLGIPAQLVAGETGHPDLVMAEVGGVPRTVNVGLLDERPGPGDWILVHMGFALNVMTPEEAADALDALGAEREAENREAEALQATMDAAARPRRKPSPHGGCHDRGGTGPGRRALFVRYAYPPNALGYCGPETRRLPRLRRGRRGRPGAGPAGPGVLRGVAVPGADLGRLRHRTRWTSGWWRPTGSATNCSTGFWSASSATRWPSGSAAAGQQVPVPGRGSAGRRGAAP